MAGFARLAPPLRRLFIRFDEAEAADATLRIAHGYWNMKRDAHVLPRLTDISLDELIVNRVASRRRPHLWLSLRNPHQCTWQRLT